MKHPNQKIQKNQKQFLEKLPPEKREFHAQLFRIGNTTYRYHQLAADAEPTIKYYNEWLEGLPENIKKGMKEMGFERCKTVLPFTRYVNERNDIGLEQFLKENLTIQDYEAHLETGDNLKEKGVL